MQVLPIVSRAVICLCRNQGNPAKRNNGDVMTNQPIPPPVSTEVQWYMRHHDNVVHGPYDFDAIEQAAALGRLGDGTQLRHSTGTADRWVDAGTVVDRKSPPAVSPIDQVSPPVHQSMIAIRKSGLLKHWPTHLGKQITAIAMIAWIIGVPFCYLHGSYSAIDGGTLLADGNTYLFDYSNSPVDRSVVELRASIIAWGNVFRLSLLCAAIGISGIVLYFVSPSKETDAPE